MNHNALNQKSPLGNLGAGIRNVMISRNIIANIQGHIFQY